MIFFELFINFFLIGLFTIGGGYAMIPLIESTVVSKGWISESALMDFIAISEATPGPFAINISTFIGNNVAGVGGAICATIGVVLPSLIIIIIIAKILEKFIKSKYVRGALDGVKPIVLALITSVVILMIVKIIFFNGSSLQSEFKFDIKSLTLFLDFLFYYLIKRKTGKKFHPILFILLSAILGIIVFA